jgi:maltose alpha-D-glucosyltransferase/alpha-amylase
MPSQFLSGIQNEPLWFKDAIIYEVHVRAFKDNNADGMGDFRGLTEKLDYLEDLGVTAIWLLPFFPSPWKDDGYDISDFRTVHPAYGTLRDFQSFLREAHRRGIRVITELVVNHTSDQHHWFQRSRRAEPGSRWRDFYVWSDMPDKYTGTRIIFKDFEPSNWSWDPVAKAYYWHRFYSHQPDLNFENPLVRRTVMRTLDFWAEMGVDGFRLDAIPYLYEREGTSCENLPETHAFLKELRQHIDATHPNRMLLAEANMWPEDAVAYFGNGDECHMSFHFPLMPRLFMALRLEDRLPIVEILSRTPAIPETCQWAMFLRNHDELTLEMVTDDERDYMYRVYASDQRARINLGIRRRLAPLLGNDRAQIELMNALLFSMPGTPVIYYGDEIGMGDNMYLGDRNGVRTPMQWSPDRNAGFSAANPQKLYLPVNIDPSYHYESVNVEAEEENPNSMLNWMKRLIALRKQYKAFGRGTIEFLQPSNPRVLAYFRRYQEETILVVTNLSRYPQAVQLDLHKYQGHTPVEMFGRTDFPEVGEGYYPLTLGSSSFFWFTLEPRKVAAAVSTPRAEASAAELPIVLVPSLHDLWEPSVRASVAAVLPRYIVAQRWFRSKDRRLRAFRIAEVVPVAQSRHLILLLWAEYTSGDPESYVLAVGIASEAEAQTLRSEHPGSAIAEIRATGAASVFLYDAIASGQFASALLEAFARRKHFAGEEGALTVTRNRLFRKLWGESHPNLEPELLPSSDVNTSIRYGDRFVFKLLRNVEPGPHPGVEMGRYLTEQHSFRYAAPFAGAMYYEPQFGEPVALGVLHGFVKNDGDAWGLTCDHLRDFFKRARASEYSKSKAESSAPKNIFDLRFALSDAPKMARDLIDSYLTLFETAGKRVAEMHLILSQDSADPAFAPEPFNDFYRQSLYHGYVGLTTRRLEFLRQRYSEMRPDVRLLAAKVLEFENAILGQLRAVFERRISSLRTRYHGRLHLGHMLVTGGDVVIFDFSGDPHAHQSERRITRCPIRDVTSMLMSIGYAVQTIVRQFAAAEREGQPMPQSFWVWARFWYAHASAAFLRGYWRAAKHARFLPASEPDQQILLQTYFLERALLDVRADIEDNPSLSGMPLRVILHLLGAAESERDR